MRNSIASLGIALGLLMASVVGQVTLTNNCATFVFYNNGGVASGTLDVHLAAGFPILEKVVATPGPGTCASSQPPYAWLATPTGFLITFANPIAVGQWVAVTVSDPGAVPALNFGVWVENTMAIANTVPNLVINEVFTGTTDWVEIANVGNVAINLNNFRLLVYEDPATVNLTPFLPNVVLNPCQTYVITDDPAAALPVVGCNAGIVYAGINFPWDLQENGAVYLESAWPGGPLNTFPVDALAFGYFQQPTNVHGSYPVSCPLQNYSETSPENVTMYRMETCTRFAADAFNNQAVPRAIVPPASTSFAPINPETPGCLNPGECLGGGGLCNGPRALTLRVSKSPMIVQIEHAAMNGLVFFLVSEDIRATIRSGDLMGLNPFSPLLFNLIATGIPAPFQGIATLAGTCPGSFQYELNLGALPPLPFALEIGAFGIVRGVGANPALVPMTSNVVRLP